MLNDILNYLLYVLFIHQSEESEVSGSQQARNTATDVSTEMLATWPTVIREAVTFLYFSINFSVPKVFNDFTDTVPFQTPSITDIPNQHQ